MCTWLLSWQRSVHPLSSLIPSRCLRMQKEWDGEFETAFM